MPATSLEVLGTVRPDGTLELDQKLAVPPDRVKVRVESVEAPPRRSRTWSSSSIGRVANWKRRGTDFGPRKKSTRNWRSCETNGTSGSMRFIDSGINRPGRRSRDADL